MQREGGSFLAGTVVWLSRMGLMLRFLALLKPELLAQEWRDIAWLGEAGPLRRQVESLKDGKQKVGI